ncbi:MAG: molybdate transport system ATP-binding protein [Microbacteriaceae bacterium]|nr:molybdate transport system ATP-binding protein [Microbacteriaceae bacterium]
MRKWGGAAQNGPVPSGLEQTGLEQTGLQAQIVVEREAFALRVELEVAAGSTLALLGPNGAGKSTVLRALAGLVRLSRGRISIAGTVLDDADRSSFLPPELRRVGLVPQDYLLFPHLTVVENVAFGLRATGTGREAARARAIDWLDRIGLTAAADAKPAELSGGQAQRVALARALVLEPQMLLLDEPLAALDAEIRSQLRSDLAAHLRDFDGCAIVVTHDPLDALVLGDQLVVLENGRAVQRGTPAEVAGTPRTGYVAQLMGLNLVAGRIFSPTTVRVTKPRPESGAAAASSWRGTVVSIEQQLAQVRIVVRTEPDGQNVMADITAATMAAAPVTAGDTVWISVDDADIRTA